MTPTERLFREWFAGIPRPPSDLVANDYQTWASDQVEPRAFLPVVAPPRPVLAIVPDVPRHEQDLYWLVAYPDGEQPYVKSAVYVEQLLQTLASLDEQDVYVRCFVGRHLAISVPDADGNRFLAHDDKVYLIDYSEPPVCEPKPSDFEASEDGFLGAPGMLVSLDRAKTKLTPGPPAPPGPVVEQKKRKKKNKDEDSDDSESDE